VVVDEVVPGEVEVNIWSNHQRLWGPLCSICLLDSLFYQCNQAVGLVGAVEVALEAVEVELRVVVVLHREEVLVVEAVVVPVVDEVLPEVGVLLAAVEVSNKRDVSGRYQIAQLSTTDML
jgi:hypothetical protein